MADVAERKLRGLVAGPVSLPNSLQVSVHECPRLLSAELALVVPGQAETIRKARAEGGEIFAILTAQRTETDLTEWGADAAREKDECLERVSRAAGELGFIERGGSLQSGAVTSARRSGPREGGPISSTLHQGTR
jgi:hypothetical protein